MVASIILLVAPFSIALITHSHENLDKPNSYFRILCGAYISANTFLFMPALDVHMRILTTTYSQSATFDLPLKVARYLISIIGIVALVSVKIFLTRVFCAVCFPTQN